MPPVPPLSVERWMATLSPRSRLAPVAISSVRFSVRVPLPDRLTALTRRVTPAPFMLPPVQLKPDAIVSVPAPSSTPLLMRKVPAPATDALPAVDSVAPDARSSVPPVTLAVWPLPSVNRPLSSSTTAVPADEKLAAPRPVPATLP